MYIAQPPLIQSPLRRLTIAVAVGLYGLHTLPTLAQNAAASNAPLALEEIIVHGSYTTGDKLDSATGLGLSIQETP